MTAQDNIQVVFLMNPNMGTTTSRVRDFTKINPSDYNGSKVEEDPQELIDEVYTILMIIGVTTVKKV